MIAKCWSILTAPHTQNPVSPSPAAKVTPQMSHQYQPILPLSLITHLPGESCSPIKPPFKRGDSSLLSSYHVVLPL